MGGADQVGESRGPGSTAGIGGNDHESTLVHLLLPVLEHGVTVEASQPQAVRRARSRRGPSPQAGCGSLVGGGRGVDIGGDQGEGPQSNGPVSPGGARCKHVEGYFRDDPSDDEWGEPYFDTGYGAYFVVAFQEPISLDELVDRARDAVVPPDPEPAFSPEPDGLLTQLETWLWVDTPWKPISESVEVGWVTVTVTATPLRTIWEMGDGSETVSCEGPGEEWQPAYGPEMVAPCGHTYIDSSDVADDGRFGGSVGVEWELTWQLEVGDEVEDGGLVDPDEPTVVTESEFSVDVDEIQVIVE